MCSSNPTNNTNADFDFELNKILHNNELRQINDNNNKIKIYYKNQMSISYKIDERIIRNVIKENIRFTNDNAKLNVIIYYKSPQTAQL